MARFNMHTGHSLTCAASEDAAVTRAWDELCFQPKVHREKNA